MGIETSCDETAAAVVERGRILSNIVSSQVQLHSRYQGIVPELASRAHLQKIASVTRLALDEAGAGRLDAVAYTRGPGLMGPLLVGKVAGETLAKIMGLPLLGVHHLEGHIFAVELCERLRFPLVALIVSGGHSDLVFARAPGDYRVLGRTRDDAAGEAFDKVARLLGLGYPGGPAIDRLAKEGDRAAIAFPRPLLPESDDFSFSGLKTSVLYHLQRGKKTLSKASRADVAASFQEAVVDALLFKLFRAAGRLGVRRVLLGGGVAANSRLRERFVKGARLTKFQALMPPPGLCTDNGAMIAQVGLRMLERGRVPRVLRCDPSMPFPSWGR